MAGTRFYWKEDRLYQRSMLQKDKEWEVVQVWDTITPATRTIAKNRGLAKTIQRDGQSWGDVKPNESNLATRTPA